MTQSLLISVNFCEGRYHGEGDGFGDSQEGWPPSPARLFQALVAGAAKGSRIAPDDHRALAWFERLEPPDILAPASRRGRAVKLFVPGNDLDAKGGDPARVSDIRIPKIWQPTFFDASIPLLYLWKIESSSGEAEHMCRIANRLYQLGRGIDVAWANGQILAPDDVASCLEGYPGKIRHPNGHGDTPISVPGTLASLTTQFDAGRDRLRWSDDEQKKSRLQEFRKPPKAYFGRVGYDNRPRLLHFEIRDQEGAFAARPLTSVAPLVCGLRDAAADKLSEAIPEQAHLLQRLITGRNARPEDIRQRIRLIPVPSIGHEHADPSIRRICVEVPMDCPVRADDLAWAFVGLRPCDPTTGELWSGQLVSTSQSRMMERFVESARVFRSITPVALPTLRKRRPGANGRATSGSREAREAAAVTAVMQSLRHANIHPPPVHIRVQREPLQRRGMKTEQFANLRFSRHSLWHVEVSFAEKIPGPLLIGDGRFCGLGLMEPIRKPDDILAFHIGGSSSRATLSDRKPLLRHLRRALMASARSSTGAVPPLFSGHEPDGKPDRAGHHGHVFLAADAGSGQHGNAIKRLLVLAPWTADRRATANGRDRARFDNVVRSITELRAGKHGYFENLSAVVVDADDDLLAAAKTWTSVTPYVSTRNLGKGDDINAFIKSNLCAECARRAIPVPTGIELSDIRVGPRGGRPSARIRIDFAVAVRGPLLLGRDSHEGGGLFRSVR